MEVGQRVRHKYCCKETGIVVAIKPELPYSVWVKIDGDLEIAQFKPEHIAEARKEE